MRSAVGAHLLLYADEYDYDLYYWREHNDEADFIVDLDGDLTAIEVKSGRSGMNKAFLCLSQNFIRAMP